MLWNSSIFVLTKRFRLFSFFFLLEPYKYGCDVFKSCSSTALFVYFVSPVSFVLLTFYSHKIRLRFDTFFSLHHFQTTLKLSFQHTQTHENKTMNYWFHICHPIGRVLFFIRISILCRKEWSQIAYYVNLMLFWWFFFMFYSGVCFTFVTH